MFYQKKIKKDKPTGNTNNMVAVRALKDTQVFTPTTVGAHTFSNKIVYAPTTRRRALENNVPSDLAAQYYDDRSKFPGSLVITEATIASPRFGMYERVPGIYNDEQVQAWKKITDKVHANGSFASIQLWNLGRVADPKYTKATGYPLVAPSAVYHSDEAKRAAEEAGNPLRELTTQEVEEFVQDFIKAGKNSVAAGFDYVEVHGAHGYLVDQFFNPSTNQRTDKYGGSIENRARFALEVIDGLIAAIGADKVAIRLSPWAKFQNVKAENEDVSPVAQLGYFLGELQKRAKEGKELAYVSIVEPRVSGIVNVDVSEQFGDNSFVRSIWKGVVIKAGNYTYDAPEFKTALEDISDGKTLVAFSRFFTSNPDLVQRLHDGVDLVAYNRDTFYNSDNWGYNTFNASGSNIVFDEAVERQRIPLPIH